MVSDLTNDPKTSVSASISPKRWKRLQELFDQAIELPIDERTAYIAVECGEDENLKNQVEALLFSADTQSGLLDELVRDAAEKAVEHHKSDHSQIGSFKIIEEIGDGGMGVVYLAKRDDQEFVQNVAIKILHDGLISEETQRRFLAERQILADLNHPNIARLLDGGHTEKGRPYIVMEYIDGEPLVDYCDRLALSVVERLNLFKQVCYAVAEAHRNLIVHRDIKSSNILVGKDGVPKLLDFGIAKVLNNRLDGVELAKTQLGTRLLTPDYASPEQVRGTTVTTATDIYSLGILLYQLVSGCRPFRLIDHSVTELENTICHEIPLAPSRALGELVAHAGKPPERVASDRDTSVKRLKARLKGELDDIVLMALKKEPHLRFQSASQFAADIDRHLKGLPIVAARDSRRYRARKFVSRYRVPLTAMSVFVGALLLFSITTYFQSQEISKQAADITKQKESIEDTLDFMTDVFYAANPEVLQKKSPSALDILNFAEEKIEKELADRPEILGRVRHTIAGAYFGQADLERSLVNYLASLEAITRAYGDQHPYTAAVLQDLGRYYWKTDWQKSEEYYTRAMDILDNEVSEEYYKNNPKSHQAAIQDLLRDLAALQMLQGKWNESQVNLQYAISISEKLEDDPKYAEETASNLAMLGSLNFRLSKFEKSEQYVMRALEIFKRHRSDKHTSVAEILDDLASVKLSRGEAIEAEKLYKESLSIRTDVYGEDHVSLIPAKVNLARCWFIMGQHAAAKTLLTEAVTSSRELLADDNHELAFDMVILAQVHTKLGEYSEAQQLFDDALDIYRRSVGDQHDFYGEALRQLGIMRIQQQQYVEAETLLDQAYEIFTASVGPQSWSTAAILSEKAEIYIAYGQYSEALQFLEEALPILENSLGQQHRLSKLALSRVERAQMQQVP